MAERGRSNSVSRVHLVFKTHLDVGFTDFARRVVDGYVQRFIPAALDLADALRARGGSERFVWTTGSWLIHTALERSRGAMRGRLEAAILRGDVVWHALPMTFHSELLSPALFSAGLAIARRLDARFGRRTIAAKMTDVPGHTRAIVPLLARAGVALLHLGVNRASPLPRVPPCFVWRHDDGSEVIVIYGEGYGASAPVAGLRQLLHVAHTDDNVGPPDVASVLRSFERLRREHPGARIEASTLDAYALALRRVKGRLPLITAEIGDTWIHGAASDPRKLAQSRALARLWDRWVGEDGLSPDGPKLRKTSESLLLLAEHTAGLDAKTHLGDWIHWDNASFGRVRGAPAFRTMERSWGEQRDYVRAALRSLGATPRAREARAALRALVPRPALRRGFQRIAAGEIRVLRHFAVRIDPKTGALVGLRERASGRAWAGARHPIGWLRYQSFSARDVARTLGRYNVNLDDPSVRAWAIPDFGKPGIERVRCERRLWQPRLRALYAIDGPAGDRLLLDLAAPPEARRRYGCPARFELELHFPHASAALELELRWFGKSATRLPEALWLSFVPRLPAGARWWLDKMGARIDPRDVVSRGGRGLHAVGRTFGLAHPTAPLVLETLDAALVAPGRLSLFAFDDTLPRASDGMHVLLHDNAWGTNFPLWYDDDARFRFRLGFPAAG
jgi:hypothetical protein